MKARIGGPIAMNQVMIKSLIILGFAVASTSVAHASQCVVTANALNMRKSASTKSARVTSIDKGATVECFEDRKDGNWIFVKSGSYEGWMSLGYLRVTASSSASTGPVTVVKSAGANVNVRATPNGKIVDSLGGSKTLNLSSTCRNLNSSWHAVDLPGGKCGYVFKRVARTSVIAPVAPAPAAAAAVVESAPVEALVAALPAEAGVIYETQSEPLAEVPPSDAPFVASSNYNIRSKSGDVLCTVPKGTPLNPTSLNSDGEIAKVTFSSPGCGVSEGWIAVNGLKPMGAQMKVDAGGSLALRGSASGDFLCNVTDDNKVTIIEDMPSTHQHRAWVKVKLDQPVKGCPNEGWMHREYLRPATGGLDSLPREATTWEGVDSDPEGAVPEGCDGECGRIIADLKQVVSGVRRLDDISTWNKARGLVQIPTKGAYGNIGPCGSFHYNPDKHNSNKVTDNYAAPLTACAMMAFLQAWKKANPDSTKGSRIQWGDISDKTRPYFSKHKTHTDGKCIDLRPMRKGAFENTPMQYTWSNYDQKKTEEMIQLAKSMGATPVYFNDPKCSGTHAGGHHNHVHICFPNNEKVRKTCDNYSYDANICGGI